MSNLLKAGMIKAGEEKRVIDYNELIQEKLRAIRASLQNGDEDTGNGEFIAGLHAEVVEELINPQEEIDKAQEEADALRREAKAELAKARQQAQQILQEAQQQAETMKQQAMQEGQRAGYQDGMNQGQQEVALLKQSVEEEQLNLEKDYDEKLRKMEPDLVDVILEVFEKVTHVLAEDKREMVLHLVDNALSRMESSRQFVVRVSKEDYPFVIAHKEMLHEKIPPSSEVEIVKDVTLIRNQCLIETDGGVFDCSLDVQLENLISDIKVLASF